MDLGRTAQQLSQSADVELASRFIRECLRRDRLDLLRWRIEQSRELIGVEILPLLVPYVCRNRPMAMTFVGRFVVTAPVFTDIYAVWLEALRGEVYDIMERAAKAKGDFDERYQNRFKVKNVAEFLQTLSVLIHDPCPFKGPSRDERWRQRNSLREIIMTGWFTRRIKDPIEKNRVRGYLYLAENSLRVQWNNRGSRGLWNVGRSSDEFWLQELRRHIKHFFEGFRDKETLLLTLFCNDITLSGL